MAEMNGKQRVTGKLPDRQVIEVLDALDRMSNRIGKHFNQKRHHSRTPYRAKITIYVPESKVVVGEAQDNVIIQAWTRNISPAGVTFVYSEPITEDDIIICLSPPARTSINLQAKIVRRRQVQNGIWDFGANFTGRANM